MSWGNRSNPRRTSDGKLRLVYGDQITIQDENGEVVGKPYKSYAAARDKFNKLRVEHATTTEKGKRRHRTVFSSGEIPHLWMHQAQDEARNSNNSLYFKGDVIYSYGSHFPIARHATTKRGKKAILFTTGSYSQTTSGHMSAVRTAIPKSVQVFNVPDVMAGAPYNQSHKRNLEHLRERIESCIGRSTRARSSWGMTSERQYAQEATASCKAYCKFFGLKLPKLAEIPKLDKKRLAAMRRKEAEKAAAHEERNKARNEQLRIEAEKRIESWLNGELSGYYFGNSVPVMLRVRGDQVETSLGAQFPITHARLGLALVDATIASGTEWKSNGHTCRLGHYQIERITPDGTVYAGCHVVTLAAINRIRTEIEAGVLVQA